MVNLAVGMVLCQIFWPSCSKYIIVLKAMSGMCQHLTSLLMSFALCCLKLGFFGRLLWGFTVLLAMVAELFAV